MASNFFHRLGQSFPRVRLKDTYYDRKKKKKRQTTRTPPILESVSDTVTFVSTVSVQGIFVRSVSDSFIFIEIVENNELKVINQTLTFVSTQSVSVIHNRSISQTLTFAQDISEAGIHTRSISQTLTFTQIVRAPIVLRVSQTLTFTQTTAKNQVLHETISQSLIFTQTVIVNTKLSFHLSDTLKFLDPFFVGTQLNGRFFGHRAVEYIKVPRKCAVVLQSTTSNDSIVLPCPLFDDSIENLSELTPVKRTMRGTTYTYVKRSTSLNKIKYVIDMDTQKALQLRRFLYNNQSQVIKMSNWKGEAWFSFITNNPVEMIYKGRRSPKGEEVEVQLEFSGYRA